jgi:hypothetical protein
MTANFEEVFEQLKSNLKEFQPSLIVKFDEPGKYYLISAKVDEKKREMWFGGVEIKKNYVSFHLVPIYMKPELLDGISPELKKRLTGKGCFNFTKTDDKLFAELAKLTAAGFDLFRERELI